MVTYLFHLYSRSSDDFILRGNMLFAIRLTSLLGAFLCFQGRMGGAVDNLHALMSPGKMGYWAATAANH